MLRNSSVQGIGFFSIALLTFGAAACGDAVGDEAQTEETSALIANALTANALTANALTANALTANALTANALTANALTANALTANALRDPLSRELLKYVVSCALEEDQKITVRVDGKKYGFQGSLGLAPGWGTRGGSCDGECQRWVTACVLARVDDAGVERPISVRGNHWALRPAPGELRDYTVREATYYGNLFTGGKPRYFCLAPGQNSNERVCGSSMADCPMTVVGACDEVCDSRGWFGSFSDCSTSRGGHGKVYEEAITVFLPR